MLSHNNLINYTGIYSYNLATEVTESTELNLSVLSVTSVAEFDQVIFSRHLVSWCLGVFVAKSFSHTKEGEADEI